MSILEAANRAPARAVVAAHAGTAATEAQAQREPTLCGTRPIEAEGANSEERTTAAAAVARHRQLERRGKGSFGVIAAPASSLSFPFGLGGQAVAVRTWVVDAIDSLPHIVVLRGAPIVRTVRCKNKITVTRLVAAA